MPDVSDTIDAIDAALAGGAGPAPATIPGALPPVAATVAPAAGATSAPVQTTISAIDAAMNSAPSGDTPGEAADDSGFRPVTLHVGARKPIPAADVTGDVAKSLATGIEKGAIGLATLPVTIADALHGLYQKGSDAVLGPVPAAQGPAPTTLDNVALHTGDYVGDQGVTDALEAAAGPMYAPRSIPGDFAQTIGEFIPGAGRNLVTAAILPAIGSETAGQATKGTGLEPYARVLGGVVGAGAGMLGVGSGEAATAAKNALQEYRLPASPAGQQVLAGRTLQAAASDPAALRAALDQSGEILPGSQPTTFQQSGDLGIGQLERQARNTNPAPFIQRDADQNAARVGAMQDVQPTGSPADVAAQFRQMRDALDAQSQAAVNAVTPAAQDANAAIGGHGTAEATGYALRQPLAAARAAAKENENKLWGIVKQDAAIPAGGVVEAAGRIAGSITPSARPMSGEEARIFDVASRYKDAMPFADVSQLRSSITDETAEARMAGNTQTERRLTMLRHAVDDALDHGIENQVAAEQIAVRRGTLSPEDTIEAYIARERQQLYDRRAAESMGHGASARDVADAQVGSGRVSPASRTQGQDGASARSASGDQGVSAATATPEDVAAYRRATAATKARASTFDEGTAGDILKKNGRSGFAMPDTAVPAAVVRDGKADGALAVRQFLSAGGTPDVLADAAAYTLRRFAMLGDGTLDPGKVSQWLRRNADAIKEMPPAIGAKFKTAADAQQAVNDMVLKRKADLEAFDRTAVAKIAGLSDPKDVVDHVARVLGRPDAVAQMRTLAQAAAGDPAATQGLRRALVEHMTQKLLSNTEAGASGVQQLKADAFSTYLKQNGAALRQVFSSSEMDMMNAIGRDVQRANRAVAATKGNKSGPGTAQDLLSAPPGASILTKILIEAAPAIAGKAAGGWTGAALGWLASKTIARGRAAGLENVDKLVNEALLNPALAKSLLAKVPTTAGAGTAESLGSKFAGIAMKAAAGTFNSLPGQPERRPAPAGSRPAQTLR